MVKIIGFVQFYNTGKYSGPTLRLPMAVQILEISHAKSSRFHPDIFRKGWDFFLSEALVGDLVTDNVTQG